jgi:glutamate-1-semialdehyde 2,1-aminomutase
MGEAVRSGIDAAFKQPRCARRHGGLGSLLKIHFRRPPGPRLSLGLFERGGRRGGRRFSTAPFSIAACWPRATGLMALSTPMTDADIHAIIDCGVGRA